MTMLKGKKDWWAQYSARSQEYFVFRGTKLIIITSDRVAVNSYLN